MKRIFIVFLTAFYLFLSVLTVFIFGEMEYQTKLPSEQYSLLIENNVTNNHVQTLEAIQATSIKFSVPVSQIKYMTDDLSKEEYLCIFTNNLEAYESHLAGGILPKESGEFIATFETNQTQQSGQINSFNREQRMKVYPLVSLSDDIESDTFLWDIQNPTVFERIMQDLRAQGCTVTETAGFVAVERNSFHYLYRNFFFIIAFYIFLILLNIYNVWLQCKELAIQKLLGFSEGKLIWKYALKQCVVPLGISGGITFCILSAWLVLQYGGVYYFPFFKLWIIVIAIFYLPHFILFVIALKMLFHFLQIVPAIKARHPYKFALCLVILAKIIISIGMIMLVFSSVSTNIRMGGVSLNESKWRELTNYGRLSYRDYASDNTTFYEMGEKSKQLYALESDGIFMLSSGGLITHRNQQAPTDDYFAINNYVVINQAYLNLNPIKNVNGDNIQIKNEREDWLTVLVPEKYRIYEVYIQKQLEAHYNFTYYISEDKMKEEKENIPVPEHTDKQVKIIYVKNNQGYFTYKPFYTPETYNYYIDPLAFIINDVNFGGDTYLEAISKGEFKIDISKRGQFLPNYADHFVKAGLEGVIYEIRHSQNDYIGYIQKLKQQLFIDVLKLIGSGMLLFSVVFISVLIFVKSHQKWISICIFLGYAKLRCFGMLFLSTGIYWALLMGVVYLFYQINSFYLMAIFVVMLTFEFICLFISAALENILHPLTMKEG